LDAPVDQPSLISAILTVLALMGCAEMSEELDTALRTSVVSLTKNTFVIASGNPDDLDRQVLATSLAPSK
jgi:uncharacterized membrane protein